MIIHVKVKPGSREDNIEKTDENEYTVSVKAPARDGKANISVIKLLAKHFEVSYKQVVIKTPSSRKKIIEIMTK